jgi:hypothetical protein
MSRGRDRRRSQWPVTRMSLIGALPLALGEVTMVGRLALTAAMLTMLAGCQTPRQHPSTPSITDWKSVTQRMKALQPSLHAEIERCREETKQSGMFALKQCMTDADFAANQSAGYPYMDLVDQYRIQVLQAAEKYDRGEITDSKFKSEEAAASAAWRLSDQRRFAREQATDPRDFFARASDSGVSRGAAASPSWEWR